MRLSIKRVSVVLDERWMKSSVRQKEKREKKP